MNNTKKGDSGAKLIFGNEELVSQLLRNYSGLEILKDVQAQDIEDVTDRYFPMFEEERDSDVVKKIHLKGNEKPFFLISLIEHKSRVDYNIIMHIFEPFIPQFTYKLIQLNSYTKSELIEKQDELSLVMLINKLQDVSEFKDLDLPEDYLKDLSENTPDEVLEIRSKVITVMLKQVETLAVETVRK